MFLSSGTASRHFRPSATQPGIFTAFQDSGVYEVKLCFDLLGLLKDILNGDVTHFVIIADFQDSSANGV